MNGRRGFTLIEVLVAIVLTAVGITRAVSLFGAFADQADRVARTARAHDAVVNGERLLRSLVINVQSDTATATAFGGDGEQLRATSSCMSATGHAFSCPITLTITRQDSEAIVEVGLPTGEKELLLNAPRDAHFAYLASAAEGGVWYGRWGAGIVVPLAIGVVSARDTIVLRIGRRS